MPVHYPSLTPTTSSSAAPASSDPVIANAVDIGPTNWQDTAALGAGVPLISIAAAGDGVALELPNGISGARLTSLQAPAGDFLIAGDLALGTDADLNTNAGVEVILGVAPGGLDGDIDNATWWGCRISALLAGRGNIEVARCKHNGVVDESWIGTPNRAAFKAGLELHGYRFAIQREADLITTSLVGPDGTRMQIETDALVPVTAGDIFIWARTNRVGCHAHLHRLAVSGLAWVGDRLVSE